MEIPLLFWVVSTVVFFCTTVVFLLKWREERETHKQTRINWHHVSGEKERLRIDLQELLFMAAPLARDKTFNSFTGTVPSRAEEVTRNQYIEDLRRCISGISGATLRPENLNEEAKGIPNAVTKSWEQKIDDNEH